MLPKLTATIGTALVLLLPLVAYAETGKDTFKVKVYGSGIDGDTGELHVTVNLDSGATESDFVDPVSTGKVLLSTFVFDRDESDVGDGYEACIETRDGEQECKNGTNHEKNKPEVITIAVPSSNGDIFDSKFEPVVESNHAYDLETEQRAECNINGDNNRCEIDQGFSLSDTIRDVQSGIDKIFNN